MLKRFPMIERKIVASGRRRMSLAAKENLTTLIAIAALAAYGVSIAAADSIFESRSARVRFGDLDTTSDRGAAVLYQRIENAAKIVCGDLEPDGQLSRYTAYTHCVHVAIGDAIAKIDRPAVTAYASSRGLFRRSADGKLIVDK